MAVKPVKAIVCFVLLAYVASAGIALAIHLTGGREGSLVTPLGLAAMLVPATAAAVVRRSFGEARGDIGLRTFSAPHAALALLTPVAVTCAAAAGFLALVSDLQSAAWLTPDQAGMLHPSLGARFGGAPFPASTLGVKVTVSLLVNLAIVSVFVTTEELGWRGFLQPRLASRYGVRRGAVLTAVTWAFWHTGFHLAGVHYLSHLIVVGTTLAGPAMLIGSGTFFGWLYVRTRSLWVVVLGHASANAWSQFPLRFIDVAPSNEAALLVTVGCAFLLLGLGTLLWLPWFPAPRAASASNVVPPSSSI
jgi:membrane protease YdiL (CAAX protease family)